MSNITRTTSFDISVNPAFSATITVSANSGCAVTANSGSYSVSCIWNGTNYVGTVNQPGTYIVTDGTNTETINIVQAANYKIDFLTVTIILNGYGNSSSHYVLIAGSKRYGTGVYTAHVGDVLTFAGHGYSTNYSGTLYINKKSLKTFSSNTVSTYDWTIPIGTKVITIGLNTCNYVYDAQNPYTYFDVYTSITSESKTVNVTVSGTGNASIGDSDVCCAVINGSTVISPGSYTVHSGDVITLGGFIKSGSGGDINIDGCSHISNSNNYYGASACNYFIVPYGISSLSINLAYYSGSSGNVTVRTF